MTIHHHLHEQSDPHLQLEALVQPLPQEQDPERSNAMIQGFFLPFKVWAIGMLN